MSTSSFLLKGLGLVVFLGAIAGATYGVQQTLGVDAPPISAAALRLDAVHPLLNATPGHSVTFALVASNRGDAAVTVTGRVSGEGFDGSTPAAVIPANGNTTLFVSVAVPDSAAEGTRPLTASITTSDGRVSRQRADLLQLRVIGPGVGFEENDRASILYVGRVASTGKVFDTNDPSLSRVQFPRDPAFGTVSGATNLEGLFLGVLGMQAGESRRIDLTAEQAFGNRTEVERVNRTEAIDRAFTIDVARTLRTVNRPSFDSYINDSEQGDPTTFQVGDTFTVDDEPNTWRNVITNISADSVTFHLSPAIGSTQTLYPFWPNASIVTSANETAVVLRTTPSTAVGENFTSRSYWPEMSALDSLNETAILVKHTPLPGFKYPAAGSTQQRPRESTVREVLDDVIVISTPSLEALAGEDLIFDVYMASLTK